MAILTLFICAFIPSILAQCSVEKAKPFLSRSVFEFSTELMKRIAQDTDNHFIASTLSPWTLLAYTSLGAKDNSYEELVKILRLHRHKCFMNKFFDVTKEIYTPTAETTLEGASAIFVVDNIPVNERFQEEVRRAGLGDIKQVSTDNYEYVAATINNYVKTATNGAIDEIVVASDLENIVMMIVDALRFKGTWKNPFPVNGTQQMPFYDEMSNEIGTVNLMSVTDVYNTRFNNEINATVVELPYSDNRFSMLLFVPYADEKLSNVIDAIGKITLKSIFLDFAKKQPMDVVVRMPRFKIASDLNNLRELLIDMGLRSIFDPSQASFPKIADYPLYISNLIQKAEVEVTEEGTIASAATEVEFSFKSFPTTVDANKPFFFMIVDKKTYIPVFSGAYSKPSVY
ncbi:PREDICTED: serine protease inhibitor 2.1-like [Papilio polytes]|uniref:serine protease inhibitor 2.1-like n=1 Tax=Papilio polytes TaxID=76194 RepID=UPI0006761776|nr:PREDICTED: serine protease inhibitor 2.1-like [Papilio polytes]